MTSKEKLLENLEVTNQIVKKWPQWKRTVSHARPPVAKSNVQEKTNSR